MIRIGRRIYNKNGFIDPLYPDFKPIICLTKSTEYGSLGPYVLMDDRGRIMENLYQASKIYESIPETKQKLSRYNLQIIWNNSEEEHYDQDTKQILPKYWLWRKKLEENRYPVRYPVGIKHRHKCLFAIKELPGGSYKYPLNYIQSRKEIYMPLYVDLVERQLQFRQLIDLLNKGENLLIIEVDGPHQESLNYYKDHYNVDDNFIINNTMLATVDNLKIMLEDPLHPFGHGYCLAIALKFKAELAM